MSDPVNYDPFAGGDVAAALETTETQKELWLAAQLSAEANCSYNLTTSLAFPVTLDPARFRAAMARTAMRHGSLRSTFSHDGAYCHVASEPPIDCEVVEDADADAIAAARDRGGRTGFDLAAGPLWRATLLQTRNGTTVLLTTHHIAVDGWSTGIVLADLARYYGDPDAADDTPATQMQDYLAWLDQPDIRARADADLDYWIAAFREHTASASLPSLEERRVTHDFRCGFVARMIEGPLLEDAKRYANAQRVTLSTLLTTAFAACLGSLTGQRDVVIGIPTAAQLDSGNLDLVGHCVNTLPFRASVDGATAFRDVLAATRTALLDAFEHQKVTFGSLLKASPALRDRLEGPLVPVVFNVEPSEFEVEFDGVPPAIEFLPRQFDNFNVSINCAVTSTGLLLEAHYSAALYDEEYIQARLAEYCRFLQRVTADDTLAVASVPLLSDEHSAQIARLNDTAVDHGPFRSIPALIGLHAARTPDRCAFLHGGDSLSYAELEASSDSIAVALRERGIARGDLVAFAVPRSLDMVAALAGVLKAGAAYLPIDDELPANRVACMLDDARVRAIVTTESVRGLFDGAGCDVHTVDELKNGGADGAGLPEAAPEDTAYVIYTSGSTGNPKGVSVSQGAVWNLLNTLRDTLGFSADDRFIGLTTLSFDIAVLEIWEPVLLGASSVIADRGESRDGRAISRLIEAHGVTVVQATPSSWKLLLASGWQGGPNIVAVAGGEPLVPEFVAQVAPLVRTLWNGYGPTEAAVYTLFKEVAADGRKVSIGRPVANTQVHILGQTGAVLPPGIVGEMCISGDCLAQGYLDRPELTAEKFRYHEGIGRVVYHTGDLGYLDARANEIHCLGRVDDQVKVRGYRIELGEISTKFVQLFGVTEAAALVTNVDSREQIAVAYRSDDGNDVPAADARRRLAEHLPEYMVPTLFVRVDRFELTPNGKIDRKKTLRTVIDAGSTARPSNPDDEAAYSDTERLVVDVVRDALGTEGLRLRDNFFDAGGHSLVAMRTVIALGELLDVELDLALLFDHPVLEDFAAQVERVLLADIAAGERVVTGSARS